MGVRKGVKTLVRHFFWNWNQASGIISKPELRSLIPIKLI